MTKKTNEKVFRVMSALLFVGIVIVGIFIGYTNSPASKGIITDKTFVAAEYEVKEESSFLLVGKVPITNKKDYIYEYPDRYILTVVEERFFNCKVKTDIYVTEEAYNSVEVGEEYKFRTNTDTYRVPYKKYRYLEGTTPLPETSYKPSD